MAMKQAKTAPGKAASKAKNYRDAKPDVVIDDPRLRPQNVVRPRENLIIGLLTFLGALVVYSMTLARSLSFWDCGEYITCGSILGIPHAPGNPFYIILGRVVSMLAGPIPHALAINFLSGLESALAVMFFYFFVVKVVSMYESNRRLVYLAGVLAAFWTAFSFTFWYNSVEAEVYCGLAMFINLVMWLTMVWVERNRDFSHQNILLVIIYLLFLGFCIHQTTLQIAPAILFIAVYPMMIPQVRTLNFWVRLFAYGVVVIILYTILFAASQNPGAPNLSKWGVAMLLMGLMIFHLRGKVSKTAWWLAIAVIAIGFSPHLYLLVRSELRPFINEGFPHNWQLFKEYILRLQYGKTSFMERRFQADTLNGAAGEIGFMKSVFLQFYWHFLRYFGWQFFDGATLSEWFKAPQHVITAISHFLVALLGFVGMYYQWIKNKHSWAYLFAFFFLASFAMVFVMNLSHDEVRDRDYFFTTAYYLWTAWMAIASVGAVKHFWTKLKPVAYLALGAAIFLPALNLASMYHIHDRSREFSAGDYGQNFLNSVEENAIIFTNGDNDTFPLWYAQAVRDPHLKVNSYPETDTKPTATTLKLREEAMAYKKTQLRGIRPDVTIANLSLLNTPWYIRQLRDKEGIEFNIKDEYIDQIEPYRAPSTDTIVVRGAEPGDSLVLRVKKDTPMYIKNIATLQIIKDNFGKRPIYFGVTIPDEETKSIGIDRNLRNEGMVDRLVPDNQRAKANYPRLLNNIEHVYEYRSIFDTKCYKDENIVRLIGNYGAGFIRASDSFKVKQDYTSAITYMERGMQFYQGSKPIELYQQARFHRQLGELYRLAGREKEAQGVYQRAITLMEKSIAREITNPDPDMGLDPSELQILLSSYYFELGDFPKGMAVLDQAAANSPGDPRPYLQAAYLLFDDGQSQAGFQVLEKGVMMSPKDPKMLDYIYRIALDNQAYKEGIQLLDKMRQYQDPRAIQARVDELTAAMNIPDLNPPEDE
jgi:tetratricopeptide (TPR) repeat protein